MNMKTIKALAIALPMSLCAGKAGAQSSNILKAAERIVTTDSTVVAKDTLKALDAKAADARTYVMKKYNGHFNGNVRGGRIADGTLEMN